MKTTHQLARELLMLPDIPLLIEGWCEMDNHEMVAERTSYSEHHAIIWQKPDDIAIRQSKDFAEKYGKWRWLNINDETP